jgi:hypothetical protein
MGNVVTTIYTYTPVAANWGHLIRADSVPARSDPNPTPKSTLRVDRNQVLCTVDLSHHRQRWHIPHISLQGEIDIASMRTLEGPARSKVVRPPRVMMTGERTIALRRSVHFVLKESFGPLRPPRKNKS